MTKYRIHIPKPSAKRTGDGVLIVTIIDGGLAAQSITKNLSKDQTTVEFEVHNIPWAYDIKAAGPYFDVKIEYTNKNKTRQEIVRPVPEKI